MKITSAPGVPFGLPEAQAKLDTILARQGETPAPATPMVPAAVTPNLPPLESMDFDAPDDISIPSLASFPRSPAEVDMQLSTPRGSKRAGDEVDGITGATQQEAQAARSSNWVPSSEGAQRRW